MASRPATWLPSIRQSLQKLLASCADSAETAANSCATAGLHGACRLQASLLEARCSPWPSALCTSQLGVRRCGAFNAYISVRNFAQASQLLTGVGSS